MNLIHIIDCYYWIWIQSAIDNERCLWLWGSNANVNYGKIYSVRDGVTPHWKRDNRAMRWDCVSFQRVEPCTYHKNTSNIFTVSYLILIHLWNWYILAYIIHSLPQAWNEIIADNQHNPRRVRVHSHDGQWMGIVMLTHSSAWMHQWCMGWGGEAPWSWRLF